jgi:hypothetical protein
MYWKTIHMLIENERSVNTMPPLRDRDNNLNLSYDCFEKADILNIHFCSVFFPICWENILKQRFIKQHS